jgi:hypothetical protein
VIAAVIAALLAGPGPAWSQCTTQMTGEQALALEERLLQRRAQ